MAVPRADIVTLLRETLPTLLAVYAFGSRVRGTANADSDLDLAVLVEGYADPMQLFALAATLADALGYEIDLLDLRAASTVMQYQVLQGERLWAKDTAAGIFEAMVLSEKMALDEARAPLLQDIDERGYVYGR